MNGWVFHLPDLGEGLAEAEIVSWHVAAGDHVVEDQPLVSVETDKAIMEIPAPRSGRISKCYGTVGDILDVGAALVEYNENVPDSVSLVGDLPTPPARVGNLPTPPARVGDLPTPPAKVGDLPTPPGKVGDLPTSPARVGDLPTPPARVKASPAARRRARELGIDLHKVAPQKGSVIQVADVDAAAQPETGDSNDHPTGTRLRGIRRAMAERMADAHARVVPATVTGEADVHLWQGNPRPMSRLVRAIGAARAVEPQLNAWFDDARMSLDVRDTVDLGVATETPDGLIVPVLRDVTNRTPEDLEAAMRQLERDVRSRRVSVEHLHGQTITLSNFGAFGGLFGAMVVVPPQVAIVGAGRIFQRLCLCADGTPAQHAILPLSVTFDHRVVTGIESCRFLDALIRDLESAS